MSDCAQIATLNALRASIPEEDIVTVLNTFQAHKENFKAMSPEQLDEWMRTNAHPQQESQPLPPQSFARREEERTPASQETRLG